MKHSYFSRKTILATILSAGAFSALAQPATFSYSGTVASYTVPAGVTKLGVTAFGAQGGNQTSDPAFGGAGARLYGEFTVTPGHVLNIIAGEQPPAATNTGGGGGGSFVWDVTAGNVLLIAAGGGGGAGLFETSDNGIDAVLTANGTNGAGGATYGGGGTGGNGGTALTGTCFGTYGAGGAGWLSNGADGYGDGCTNAGGGVMPLTGGAGGASGGSASNGRGGFGGGGGSQGQCSYSGAGGGGGYSGGGGGNYTCSPDGANPGGGGGSYNGGVNQSNSVGNTGNGIVVLCPFPVAGTITGLSPFCTGANTTMVDSAADAGGTWSSSDNTIATIGSSSGIVTGMSAGSVTITYMTPTNACGTSIATTTVSINPLPVISAGSNVGVCLGSSTTLTGTGGTSYTWSPSAGLSCTTCSNPIATPDTATTYTLMGTDANGCSNTATVTVSINPLPTAYNVTVTNSGRYCAGGSGVHIGLDNSASGVNYQLYYGLSPIGSPVAGIDTAIDFGADTAAGSYTVIATDTTTGCTNIMDGSANVVIVPVVTPSVSILTNTPTTICDGTNTTFTAVPVNGGTAPSYQWNVGGFVVGTDSPSYTYPPSDGNVVSVRMISNAECAIPDTVMDSITMTVLPVVNPSVDIMSTPGDTVCQGSTITLTANPSHGGTTPFFTWIKNTAIVSTSPSYSYIPSDSDNVYVIMLSNYMCPSSLLGLIAFSNSLYIRVDSPIVPAVTITGRPGMIAGVGKPDTLIATVTNGGPSVTYQWYVNGSPVPGATSSIYIQTSFHDKDSLSCLVTRQDACGLATINSVVITVKNVGVAELENGSSMSLVPNPNRGVFTLKGALASSIDEEVSAQIVNLLGQVVYDHKFVAKDGKIDEAIDLDASVANGVYLLNLHSQSGNNVIRFVVEK